MKRPALVVCLLQERQAIFVSWSTDEMSINMLANMRMHLTRPQVRTSISARYHTASLQVMRGSLSLQCLA